MPQTRVGSEQLTFNSSVTGVASLDAYMEACEIGGRTLHALLGDIFDTNGIFLASGFYDWKGNWTTSTAYVTGDTFVVSSTKNLYVTLTTHTSSSIASDLSATKIALVIDVSAVATSETNAATSETNAASSAFAASSSAAAASADVAAINAKITVSTSSPSGGDDGDIWYKVSL